MFPLGNSFLYCHFVFPSTTFTTHVSSTYLIWPQEAAIFRGVRVRAHIRGPVASIPRRKHSEVILRGLYAQLILLLVFQVHLSRQRWTNVALREGRYSNYQQNWRGFLGYTLLIRCLWSGTCIQISCISLRWLETSLSIGNVCSLMHKQKQNLIICANNKMTIVMQSLDATKLARIYLC